MTTLIFTKYFFSYKHKVYNHTEVQMLGKINLLLYIIKTVLFSN